MVGVISFVKCFNGHEIIKCVTHKDKTNGAVRKVNKTEATNLQQNKDKLISRHVLLPLYPKCHNIMFVLFFFVSEMLESKSNVFPVGFSIVFLHLIILGTTWFCDIFGDVNYYEHNTNQIFL